MVVKKQHFTLALLFASGFLISHSAFSMKRHYKHNPEVPEHPTKRRRIDNNCQFAKDEHTFLESFSQKIDKNRDPLIEQPIKRTRQR